MEVLGTQVLENCEKKKPLMKKTGEGNDNPLQYSCLENPVDKGAWWAAVYGVAQSRTRLKRLSSSSSNEENREKNNPTIL